MVPHQQSVPIIIRRKKVVHASHHGGAWKVAYADFVTALMALFIVLWLMLAKQQVQQAIGEYFRHPDGKKKTQNVGGSAGSGQRLAITKQDMERLKKRIENAFKQNPEFMKKLADKTKITVTPEGLRIEFLENDKGVFFQSGSPAPTPDGVDLLTRLAAELGPMNARLLIEGHTDSHPYSAGGAYSNWELSADRANAARRLMQGAGVKGNQITQVRGYADQDLRDPEHPESASNRRITIVVLNESVAPPAAAKLFAPNQKTEPAATDPHPAPAKH